MWQFHVKSNVVLIDKLTFFNQDVSMIFDDKKMVSGLHKVPYQYDVIIILLLIFLLEKSL